MKEVWSTAPPGEPDYTNPNGIPDYLITEKEARLWLLSQSERAAGLQVEFDRETMRWQRAGAAALPAQTKLCDVCRKIFTPSRMSALYCSTACKQKAVRRRGVSLTGRLVSQ